MVTLANHFVRLQYNVQMIVVSEKVAYLSEVDPAILVHFLKSRRRIQVTPSLARIMRNERFDALLSSPRNFPPILARWITRSPTRVVIREATTPTVALAHRKMQRRVQIAVQLGYRLLYPCADAIVAPSYGVAHSLLQMASIPSHKLHVIRNPAITPDLFVKANAPLDHPWFRSDAPPVVLGAGRLVPLKGFDILLHAFARVREQMPARLVILGEGEERPRLLQLASDLGVAADVELPGFDLNPFRYMKRASVFVLSSWYEGLPNVLIQALACGCPVVSTDCPSGPSEILDGGRYGALVPVGDAEAMARAIVRALREPPEPVPAEWLQQFELDQVAQQYLNLLLPD
ncbi:MAG: glycosyltransferase [Armatimonadetes bacterium]|nr:glycosyltransferase [Armatimonadota bacterium]CUU37483.1 Glycosyltransferase involved in cell wall bisynthesis [Armatimonadetes bacterium DC]